jgi:hypothetical protein
LDPGHPTHISESLTATFWVQNILIVCHLAQISFRTCSKNKIIFNFVSFMAKKRLRQQKNVPLLFFVVGFGMRKNQDPG